MVLNLHENHLSYVTNPLTYLHKYRCESCERHFSQLIDLQRHQGSCVNATKFKFPGQAQMSCTIFDGLEEFDIVVPPDERTYPWFVQGCHSLARTKFPTFSQPFPDPCSNFPNQRNAFGNLFNSINDWMFNDMHSREYILCKRVSQSDTMLGRQHLRMSQICMPGIITMTTRQHWRGRNPMFFLSKIFHFNQHQNDLNQ